MKEDMWRVNKHLGRCSASPVLREMQIETQMRHSSPPAECQRWERWTTTSVGKDVKLLEFPYIASGSVEGSGHFWEHLWQFLKKLNTDLLFSPAIPLLPKRNGSLGSRKDVYTNGCSSLMNNNSKLETVHQEMNEWITGGTCLWWNAIQKNKRKELLRYLQQEGGSKPGS